MIKGDPKMTQVTRIKCGGTNCFCLENNGSAILIDTSRTSYRDKILNACRGKNVRLIILTHGHIDHIQNAAVLSKELNAPIAIHRADYEMLCSKTVEPLMADTISGRVLLAMIQGELKEGEDQLFETDVFLADGDTLEQYGIEAAVIGLPGHTKGSIGVIVADSDIFVGDALMNIIYPAKSLMYGNRQDMFASAARISGYKNATVHFGHGRSVPNRVW